MIDTLYVDQTNRTFADALTTYGLATIVGEILRRLHGDDEEIEVILNDCGVYYRLDLTPDLDLEQLTKIKRYAPHAPVIRTVKNAKKLPEALPPQAIIDYEVERDQRGAYFEARKQLSQAAQAAMRRGAAHPELEQLRGLQPHPDWDIFRAINPAALIGYNKLTAQWWQIQDKLPEVLGLLFALYADRPNDTKTAVSAWKKLDKEQGWKISATTSALQLYDPAQGKGQNRTKGDKLTMSNIRDAFWLTEWLKAVGFYRAALTKQLRGVKDRKTYVLRPVEITLNDSKDVMVAFKGAMVRAQSSIQSDVLAALRYTKALLQHSQEAGAEDFATQLFQRAQPARIVAGFYTAFYKNLGNSAATMNLAFIGLPGWIHVTTPEEVEHALTILNEHERVVRQFDESHSDDVNLLLSYRDFISSSDLWPFFDFTTAYCGYIIGQRERSNGRARQFSTDNLRRLIVSAEPKLSKILDTPGFQNIAYAIRQSTVLAQHFKKQGDRRYSVRYGLNQELARKANYPDDFVAALSQFLHTYNAENAQVIEKRSGPYRRSIQTTDVEDIVALIDEFGSELVCQLLLAYGYARVPRPEQDDETNDA